MRPLVSMSIRPVDATAEQLRSALNSLALDDPTFTFTSQDSGEQVTMYGMGELHLEIVRDRLLREYDIQVEASEPQVILLETIRSNAEGEAKFIRQSGPRGQYAHVKLRVETNSGGGYEFVNEVKDGGVPSRFIAAVNEGIKEALKGGVLAGYEMVDVKAVLCGGSYHEADSNEMAFKIVGSMATKEAARKASPVLLEPVMSVEVVVPEEFMGTIIGDLNSRRGRIEGMEHRAGSQVIRAMVPLREMFGYPTEMRSNTQGRATFAMQFARYEDAPHRRASDDENGPGVTANTPRKPAPKSGAAAVPRPTESNQ